MGSRAQAHDRLLSKAHAFCSSVASKYPATLTSTVAVPLHTVYDAVYDASEAAAADRKVFVATISIVPPFEAGAKVSVLIPPSSRTTIS